MSVLCTLDEFLERLNTMPITEGKEPRSAAPEPITQDGKLSSADLIKMIKTGQNWHSNMLQLVAHWLEKS